MKPAPASPPLMFHPPHDPESLKAAPDLPVLQLLRRVFTYTRPYKRSLVLLIGLAALRSLLLGVLAWSIAAIINGPIERRDPAGIMLGVAGFAALALFTQAMFHFRIRIALELGEAAIHDLRQEVFEHLQRLTVGFFDRTKIGRIIGRMTSDIDAVRVGVQDIVFVSLVQVGQMLVTGAMMLWCDRVLFLLVLAIAPVVYFLNVSFKRRISRDQRQAQESFARVTATLAETVSGIRVTQGFAREDVNAAYFRGLVQEHTRYNLATARTSAVFLPLLDLSSQFFIAMMLLLGGWRVLNPAIAAPVADIVQFFFLANLFFDPVRVLGNQFNNGLIAMVGAERVFRLLDTEPDWSDPPDAADPGPLEGRVAFRDVSFGYNPERLVLENITFTAQPGQIIALVGHTGSGKTSITGLITKMHLPGSGTILLDGRDITQLSSGALHRQMGVVHQHSFLFAGTVLDNIRFSRPNAPVPEVVAAARELGFLDLIEALPDGFDTRVGEDGAGLSVGQRQIINLARAMLADPRILILDEATSSIDALTEARMQNALSILLRGRTSFVVAHRLSTIRKADTILVLDRGKIVERGTHGELLAAGGVYRGLHQQFVLSATT